MKTIFTFGILVVATCFLSFGAMAQTALTGTINAEARVLDDLLVGGGDSRDLLFGAMLADQIKSVTPAGVPTVNGGSLFTANVQSGAFMVQATAGSSVELTFTLPAVLDGPGGATLPINFATNAAGDPVDFAAIAVGDNLQTAIGGALTAFSPVNAFTHTVGTNALTGFSNGFFVLIGGTVSAAAAQATGTYTGVITLEAAYN
ncbi:MAG: hypothetical protein ACXIT9_00575 [Nitritalea sp.]